MSKDLQEIEKLNADEENKLEAGQRIGELGESSRNKRQEYQRKLKEGKKEIEARAKALKSKITTERKRLKESSQKEFIIDLVQPPGKVESKR